MKQYKKTLLIAAFLLSAVCFCGIERGITGSLATQKLAERWSKEETFSQIACYFTEEAGVYEDEIAQIEYNIIQEMEAASIGSENEAGGRNWLDAYATQGQLFISSSRTSMEVRAFGIGGDFFQFHPLTLLDGSYFDATEENGDGVVLDEVTAWQLFGSSHVAGMEVEINNVIYPVRGVVRSDVGFFSEAVKEEAPTIYVSYQILEGKEEALPIDCYEVLLASPVKDFGTDTIKKVINREDDEVELVECSTRFDLKNRFAVIKKFGIRSMTTKNIVFPYWENRARGYEDISALFLVLELICLVYPVACLFQRIARFWKNKKVVKQKLLKKCKEILGFFASLLKNHEKTFKVKNKK